VVDRNVALPEGGREVIDPNVARLDRGRERIDTDAAFTRNAATLRRYFVAFGASRACWVVPGAFPP